jgi:hypothetical protein
VWCDREREKGNRGVEEWILKEERGKYEREIE